MALELDSVFEANGRSIGALVASLLIGALANAAGVGGGAIYIPMFHVIVGFALKPSTVLSQAVITAGAIISVGLKLPNRHPIFPKASLIDFDIVLALTPVLLVGVSAGVLLNVLLAEWLITFLLLILLVLLSVQSVTKGVKLWQQESRAFQAPSNVQLPLYSCPETSRALSAELPTDVYASLDCLEGCDGTVKPRDSRRAQDQERTRPARAGQSTSVAPPAYVPFTYRRVFDAIFSLESFEGLDYSSAGAPWQPRYEGSRGAPHSRPSFSLHSRTDIADCSGHSGAPEAHTRDCDLHQTQQLLLMHRQGSSDATSSMPPSHPPSPSNKASANAPDIRTATTGNRHLQASPQSKDQEAPPGQHQPHPWHSDSSGNPPSNSSRLMHTEQSNLQGSSYSWLLRRSAWRQRVHQHAALSTDDPLAVPHSYVEALDLSGWRAEDRMESPAGVPVVRPTAAAADTAVAVAAATAQHMAATAKLSSATASTPGRPDHSRKDGGSGNACHSHCTVDLLSQEAQYSAAQCGPRDSKRQSLPIQSGLSWCRGQFPDGSALPVGLIVKTICSWLLFVGLQLGKSLVRTCSNLFWGLYATQVVSMLLISLVVIRTGRRAAATQAQQGGEDGGSRYRQAPGSEQPSFLSSCTTRLLSIYAIITFIAGLTGGLLGLGGGMLMGPLLLEMGIIPQVTSATSSVMVLFSSSAALIQFAILHLVNLDYALVFGAAGMVSAMLGVVLSAVLLARLNRPSIIVLALSAVIVMGTGLVCIFGLMSAVQDLESHQNMFGSICPS